MLKDFSIENWILGGTAFVLIFTIGCFVWFQFQMSTIEVYDSNQEEAIQQHIDEASDTDHEDIQHIEINDTEDNDTTGKNSTEVEVLDDEFSDATATQQNFSVNIDASVDEHRQHLTRNTEMKLLNLNI